MKRILRIKQSLIRKSYNIELSAVQKAQEILVKEKIAESLPLPKNRVAIRDINAIQLLHKNDTLPKGPDFVTPISIEIAAQQNPMNYKNVTVNGRLVRMFDVNNLLLATVLYKLD